MQANPNSRDRVAERVIPMVVEIYTVLEYDWCGDKG
jgi:hypothetical protein